MKKVFLLFSAAFIANLVVAQTYPQPEFSNEVYYLKKDSVYSLVRLEKNASSMDTKTKMGGFGGSESGYSFDKEKSPVHINKAPNLSFVFSTGATSTAASSKSDSMMRANGMDPSMMQGMGSMNDPSNTITLYKVESSGGNRKILLMKSPGAMPFGSKKTKSSDKFTFSVKKIREGYWELIIDKNLAAGEYAFSMTDMKSMTMSMGVIIFAFEIN